MAEKVEVLEIDETKDMYLEQIRELKEKMDSEMISKEEYNKLQLQHKKLMDDYVNRRPVVKAEPKQVRSTKEVAQELSKIKDGNISNRSYVEKTLEYRASHISEFGTDPFTDFGSEGPQKPTDDTNLIADTLKQLLDENQSPVDFRLKLHSVMQDDPQLLSKLRKR